MNEGLKELKRLPKAIKDTFKDSFNIIEKELKALDIIKKYALYIDWNWLFDCVKKGVYYEDYMCECNATDDIIFVTEKEYNSLKEVLL